MGEPTFRHQWRLQASRSCTTHQFEVKIPDHAVVACTCVNSTLPRIGKFLKATLIREENIELSMSVKQECHHQETDSTMDSPRSSKRRSLSELELLPKTISNVPLTHIVMASRQGTILEPRPFCIKSPTNGAITDSIPQVPAYTNLSFATIP